MHLHQQLARPRLRTNTQMYLFCAAAPGLSGNVHVHRCAHTVKLTTHSRAHLPPQHRGNQRPLAALDVHLSTARVTAPACALGRHARGGNPKRLPTAPLSHWHAPSRHATHHITAHHHTHITSHHSTSQHSTSQQSTSPHMITPHHITHLEHVDASVPQLAHEVAERVRAVAAAAADLVLVERNERRSGERVLVKRVDLARARMCTRPIIDSARRWGAQAQQTRFACERSQTHTSSCNDVWRKMRIAERTSHPARSCTAVSNEKSPELPHEYTTHGFFSVDNPHTHFPPSRMPRTPPILRAGPAA